MIVTRVGTDAKTGEVFRKLKFSSGAKLTIFGDPSLTTRQMYQLTQFGVDVIQNRVSRGIGSNDQPMPGLKRGYAIAKTKAGKGNRRNLQYSGEMLANLTVRSVSASQGRADITSAKQRLKARVNEQKSPWFGWSARDLAQISAMSRRLFGENIADFGVGRGRGRAFGGGAQWMDPKGMRATAGVGRLAA
jgi:hypothetical protein